MEWVEVSYCYLDQNAIEWVEVSYCYLDQNAIEWVEVSYCYVFVTGYGKIHIPSKLRFCYGF